MVKLDEQTNGNHIYMRMILDNRAIEEIDVYLDSKGNKRYVTSADHGNHVETRKMIIEAFEELY